MRHSGMNHNDRSRNDHYRDEMQQDYYPSVAYPVQGHAYADAAAAHLYQQNAMLAQQNPAHRNGIAQYVEGDGRYYERTDIVQPMYYSHPQSPQAQIQSRRGRHQETRDDERYADLYEEAFEPRSRTTTSETRTSTERTRGTPVQTSCSRSTSRYESSTTSSSDSEDVNWEENIMSALNDMAGNLKKIGGIQCNQAGPDSTEVQLKLNLPLSPKRCSNMQYGYNHLDEHVIDMEERFLGTMDQIQGNMMPVYKSLFQSQSGSSEEDEYQSESSYEDPEYLPKSTLNLHQERYENAFIGEPPTRAQNVDGIPLNIIVSNQASGVSSAGSWKLLSPRDEPQKSPKKSVTTTNIRNRGSKIFSDQNESTCRDTQWISATKQTLEIENKETPMVEKRKARPNTEIPQVIDVNNEENVAECYSDLTLVGIPMSADQEKDKSSSIPAIKTEFSGDEIMGYSKASFQRNSTKKGTAFNPGLNDRVENKAVLAKSDPPTTNPTSGKSQVRKMSIDTHEVLYKDGDEIIGKINVEEAPDDEFVNVFEDRKLEEERQLREESEKEMKLEKERKQREAEEKLKLEKERKQREVEEKLKLEKERKQREAEEKMKLEKERKRREAEEKAAQEALEAKRLEERVEAEIRAAREALKAKKMEEERKKREAEEKAAAEALETKRLEEERKQREAEAKAAAEVEKAKMLEEERKRIDAEAKAAQEALEAKRLEGERKQREAEAKAAEEALRAKKLEAERKRIEAETKAAQEALDALYQEKVDEERRQREAKEKKRDEDKKQREANAKLLESKKLKAVRKRVEAETKAAEEEARKLEEERRQIEAETKALEKALRARKVEVENRKPIEARVKADPEEKERDSLYKVQGFDDYCRSISKTQNSVDSRNDSSRMGAEMSDEDTVFEERTEASAHFLPSHEEESAKGAMSFNEHSKSSNSVGTYSSDEESDIYTDATSFVDDSDSKPMASTSDTRSASTTERLRNMIDVESEDLERNYLRERDNHGFSSEETVNTTDKTVQSFQTKDTSFSKSKFPVKSSDLPIPIASTMSTLQTFDQGTVHSGQHSLGRFIKSCDESVVSSTSYSNQSVLSAKPVALSVTALPQETKKKSKKESEVRSSILGSIIWFVLSLVLRVTFTVILFSYTWTKHILVTIGKKRAAKIDCTPTQFALQPDKSIRREEIQDRSMDSIIHQNAIQPHRTPYLGYENPHQEHYTTTMIMKPPAPSSYLADDSDEVGTCVESIVPDAHFPNISDGKISTWKITQKNTETSSLSSPPSTSFHALKKAYSVLSSAKCENEQSNWLDHPTIDDEMSYYE